MIRNMTGEDIPQVMEIWLAGNLDAHPFIPEDYWMSNYALVEQQLPQAQVFVYACGPGSTGIHGFIGLTGDYIAGLFVRRDCRSQGTGKQLLDFAKQSCPSLSLNVYQKNLRAAAFYQREGFSIQCEGLDTETGEVEYTMRWQRPFP